MRYRRGSWKSRLERLERETGEAKGSRNGFLIQHEWEMDKKAISKQCHWSGSAALQRKSVDKKWVGGRRRDEGFERLFSQTDPCVGGACAIWMVRGAGLC